MTTTNAKAKKAAAAAAAAKNNVVRTVNVANINLPSFKPEFGFDYDTTLQLAWSDEKSIRRQALSALLVELEVRAKSADYRVSQMARETNGSAHKANQTRLRKIATTYHQMIGTVNKMMSSNISKEDYAKELNKFTNHHVLTQPCMEQLSFWDMQMLHIGMDEGDQKNGIANYPMQDYAFMVEDDRGILLTLNGEQHLISAVEAHSLILTGLMDSRSQRLPYSQAGVFGTDYGTINYDGITMVLKGGSFTPIDEKDPYTFETLRLSMEHRLYTILFDSVAYGCYYDEQDESRKPFIAYQKQGELVTKRLYGDATTLPGTRTEMNRWWTLYLTTLKSEHGTIRVQSAKEQAAWFNPGRRNSYLGLSSMEDILSPEIFAAKTAAADLARQQEAEKKAAERAAGTSSAKPATNQQLSKEELADLDEHPF